MGHSQYCIQYAKLLGSQRGISGRLVPLPDRNTNPLLRVYACREIFNARPVLLNLLRQQTDYQNPLGPFPLLPGAFSAPKIVGFKMSRQMLFATE